MNIITALHMNKIHERRIKGVSSSHSIIEVFAQARKRLLQKIHAHGVLTAPRGALQAALHDLKVP